MKKRHTPEQIVRMQREAEAKLAAGSSVPEIARELGISEATFHRWKARYGTMSSKEAKRLKELESENARLKKLLAEKELEVPCLLQRSSRRPSLRTSPSVLSRPPSGSLAFCQAEKARPVSAAAGGGSGHSLKPQQALRG